MGTDSGAFCSYNFYWSSIWDEDYTSDALKCELSEEGYYEHRCRDWYKQQKIKINDSIVSDIYEYAEKDEKGIT